MADSGIPAVRCPHHPVGDKDEGDRASTGRHVVEVGRQTARREHRRGPTTGPEDGVAALHPKNRNAVRGRLNRVHAAEWIGMSKHTVTTWRRCVAGSRSWSWELVDAGSDGGRIKRPR